MLQYILRRILLFIPSLFVITLLAFIINASVPGDPVMRLLGAENELQNSTAVYDKQYEQVQHRLGLDLPLFYISLTSAASPGNLSHIHNSMHRNMIESLSLETGNGVWMMQFYKNLLIYIKDHQDDTAVQLNAVFSASTVDEIQQIINSLENSNAALQVLKSDWMKVQQTNSMNRFIPVIKFHPYNQYHRWLFGDRDGNFKGVLKGDFGNSFINGKSVFSIIKSRAGWTLFFTLGGILISLLIAIPMGIRSAVKVHSAFDKRSAKTLLLLHSLPSFFTATLLLMLFANPSVLGWLPASGVGPASGDSSSFLVRIPYLILPLLCYALASLPFIVRSVRGSMLEELDKDYILTARAKGLSEKDVVWNHAFRNSLFPLITLSAWLFPAMIGGSAILETVFSIPGMGLEIVQSIFNRDYPMIVAVFTLTGVMTVAGYLISDVLYTLADPRVELK